VKRINSNKILLQLLLHLIEKYPEQRLGQLMQNFYFTKPVRPVKLSSEMDWQNEFYSEPDEILNRVLKRMKDLEEPIPPSIEVLYSEKTRNNN